MTVLKYGAIVAEIHSQHKFFQVLTSQARHCPSIPSRNATAGTHRKL